MPSRSASEKTCTTADTMAAQLNTQRIGQADSSGSLDRLCDSSMVWGKMHQYVLIVVDGTWVQAKEMYKVQ